MRRAYVHPYRRRRRWALGLALALTVSTATLAAASAQAAAPANDNFADAASLGGPLPVSATGTNIDATKEPDEPNHAGVMGAHSVWWRWTAPVSGTITVETCASNFDSTLAVYVGASLGALTELASNDDGCGLASSLSFAASAGQVYEIAVDGFNGDAGNISLAIAIQAPPPPPPNIYVALGDSVSVGVGTTPGSGFVERYFAHLQDPANGGLDELHNLARSGEASGSMRNPGGQLDAASALIGAPSDTKVVTLGVGANDGLSGQCPGGFNTPPCPFSANYTAIVQALQAALAGDPGDETFQVMEYYNPASATSNANEGLFDFALLGGDAKVDCAASGAALGLNDLIRCVGGQHGAAPVDVYPTFKAGGQSLIADGVHPNDTGHAYIACLFAHPERAGAPRPCEPTPPVIDKIPPRAALSGRARQRVLRQRAVVLFVLLDEDATVTASARIAIPAASPRARSTARAKLVRLGPITKPIARGTRTRLRLRLPRKSMRLIRRALQARRSLTAKVRVRSTDAAGNSSLATRAIKLVR